MHALIIVGISLALAPYFGLLMVSWYKDPAQPWNRKRRAQ